MRKFLMLCSLLIIGNYIEAQPSETFTIPPRWVHWISDPDFVAEGGDVRNGFSIFSIMGGFIRSKDGYCYPHYAHRNRYNEYHGAAIQKIRISDGQLEWTNLYNHRNLPEHQLALDIVNINRSGNIELMGVKRMGPNQYPAQPARPWLLGDQSVPFMMELDDSDGSIKRTWYDSVPPVEQRSAPILLNLYKSGTSDKASVIFAGLLVSGSLTVNSVPLDNNFNFWYNFNDGQILTDTVVFLDNGNFEYMRVLNRINQKSVGLFSLAVNPAESRGIGTYAKYDYLEDENRLKKVYQKDILSKIPSNVSLNTGGSIYDVGNDRTMLFSLKIKSGNTEPHGWGIIFDSLGNEIAEIKDFFAEGTEHGYWFINTLYANEERIYLNGWPSVTGKEGIDFFSINLADGSIKNYGSLIHDGPYTANKTIGAVMTEEGDIAVRVLLYRNLTNDWYLGMMGYRAEDFGIDDLRVSTQEVEGMRPLVYQLSPNPTHSEVMIRKESDQVDAPLSLTITDLSGRKLRSEIQHCSSMCKLDVSDLASGIYFLQIQSDRAAQVETHKLIIQR